VKMKSHPHRRSLPLWERYEPYTHSHGSTFDDSTQAIQQARMEKGLSQKDCAQKINEKPSVLQDYESGKAIPNTQILSKLERLLGVKLRGTFTLHCPYHITYALPGSDIGKKLEGPKKS